MTTPEPVSPEVRRSPDGRLIAYCRSARHGLWRKSDGYDCDPEDVADWTPLVPAVSPVPDTEALRNQLARAISVQWLDDESLRGRTDYYSLSDAVLPIIAEREAGLRADLDQARAEATGYEAALRSAQRALVLLEQQRDALRAAICRAAVVDWNTTNVDTDYEAMLAHLAGARPIPDDAAERLARWLFRMTGRRQGEPLYGDGAASPERQEKRWNTWLEDEDRDRLREMARHVLADLGATPTTDTAPANPPQVVSSVTCRADQHVMPSLPADVLRSGDRPCPCGGIVWRVTSPSTPARLCSDSAGPSDPEEK